MLDRYIRQNTKWSTGYKDVKLVLTTGFNAQIEKSLLAKNSDTAKMLSLIFSELHIYNIEKYTESISALFIS